MSAAECLNRLDTRNSNTAAFAIFVSICSVHVYRITFIGLLRRRPILLSLCVLCFLVSAACQNNKQTAENDFDHSDQDFLSQIASQQLG